MTNKSLLEELQQALKVAEEKEEIALRENKSTKPGDPYRIAVKFSDFTKAQGYTNGILEAIEITRINERNER